MNGHRTFHFLVCQRNLHKLNYQWNNRKESKRQKENEDILKCARKSHQRSRRIYGLDKLLEDVREEFPRCSGNRLYKLQKENHLYSVRRRKYKATTNSKHNFRIADNLLNQQFQVEKPNTVWVTDITYCHTEEGWLYLATVKDLFSKEIVGWATTDHMKRSLCIKALDNAIRRHRPPIGLIHHSDCGVQYCSHEYQDYLKKHLIICIMSRKGNCCDNACAETFFSTIKHEMLYYKKYQTREQARQDVFWFVE
jgi:putative transposase